MEIAVLQVAVAGSGFLFFFSAVVATDLADALAELARVIVHG